MKLCDWCEQPVLEGKELCAKCEDAQAKVAAGKLIPPPESKKRTALQLVGSGVLVLGKVLAAAVISFVMIVAALFGCCFTIATLGSVVWSPLMGLGYLAVAALAFFITYLLAKLLNKMIGPPPKRIRPPVNPLPPPLIESPSECDSESRSDSDNEQEHDK